MELNFYEKSFGLDISKQYLRLVQLKKRGNKIRLSSYSEVEVPSGLIKNGQIVKKEEAAALLKKLLKEVIGRKIFTKYTTVCLPEPKTFIKVIKIPFSKDEAKILKHIITETKKHIPYPLENAYFDWQYLDEKDKTKIIIGVCPKEIINNYQEVLKSAGLVPVALEIEAVAIARALFPLTKSTTAPVMVIDFGATRSGLLIYEKNYIPFSLSLNLSSDDLTNFIKEKLNLSPAEAEAAKKKIGLSPKVAGGNFLKLLKEPLDDLAKHIREAKYFYYEHFSSAEEIQKVLITGGGANLKGLAAYLSEQIKLDVEVSNPLFNLANCKTCLPQEKLQSYNTAIGLALRQFQ